MQEITTTDLSKFGWREKRMAMELLQAAIEQGLPDDFEDDGTTIMMNMDSGNVFFTNDEYQVAMMNGTNLESFYSCPNCGSEGFKEDIDWDEEIGECRQCSPKDIEEAD